MVREIEKRIDLSNVPKTTLKCTKNKKFKYDWKNSIGCKVNFIYDNIKGEIKIINYIIKKHELTILYLDKEYKINTPDLIKCNLGRILGKITSDFKIEIGKIFKDNKRDIIIIDREYRKHKNNHILKYYKYHCNKCGNEDWIDEYNLNKKVGCNVCGNSPKKALLGYNTIWDKARWMCDLGVSKEDAKKYSTYSHNKITVKCPLCGREFKRQINQICFRKSIACVCGDGMSYSEKFIYNLLEQLNIEFIYQLNKTTFDWCNNYKYDFYIPKFNCIVEVNGKQHYDGSFVRLSGKTLEDEQLNDKNKKELAIKNKINYYVEIDCRNTNMKWIRNSILKSDLNNILNLSKINWTECRKFALSNRIKEICSYWKLHNNINNEELTTSHLSNIFKLDKTTISKYLKKGTELGWCNYNSKDEMSKNAIRTQKSNVKKIMCVETINIYSSSKEVVNILMKKYNIKTNVEQIRSSCRGKRTKIPFTFKYLKDLSTQELLQTKQKLIQQNKSTQYIDNELNKRKQLNKSI